MKKLIKTINIKELRWDFFRGSGKGGQKRNKTENCARCTHEPSRAQAKSEDSRSKEYNKKEALNKMLFSKEFLNWARELAGKYEEGPRRVYIELEEKKINIYDNGKYEEAKRKEVKRTPVIKDKNKEARRGSKKDLKKYLD